MTPRNMARLSGLAVLMASVAAPAFAGSFYLQEQSVRGAGRAFSGEAADRGVGSMWWNPAAIARDEVKRELLANGEEAMALGVFGVPTLRVRDELFWGNDATELALAFARDPGTLDAEMRRVDAIPEAVQRRRPA